MPNRLFVRDFYISYSKKVTNRVPLLVCNLRNAELDFLTPLPNANDFFSVSREFDDQRKNMGLDFELRKTCAKFYPKILTLSASNLGVKNTQKGHFWAWLL
jgi:hypothetical protein